MKQNTLTTGSVQKSLVKFTVPIMLTLFLQTLYGAVDLLIVGQFSTVANVTAVTTSSQVMQLLTGVCTGLAMGSTIIIAQKIGENQKEQVGKVISNTVVFFAGVSVICTVLFILLNTQLVAWLQAPTEAITQTADYLFYCSLGIPMIFAYNVLGSVFRGLGDSKTPLIAVAIACVTNILLDLLLVAVFDMGATGAAIATIIAQGLSVVICLYIIRGNNVPWGGFTVCKKYVWRIVTLGTPIAMQSLLTGLSFVIITVIVNSYNNVTYSAGVGISEKLCGFIMLIPIAFMQSISAYVAQNIGANKPERAHKAFYIGTTYSFVFGAVMAVLSFWGGEYLALLFTQDVAVIDATAIYLKAYAFDTLQVPVIFCLMGFFNGYGKTTFVMIQGVLGAILLRVPFAYGMSVLFPGSLLHLGLSIPLSTFIQTSFCVIYYLLFMRKLKQNGEKLI